MRIKLLSHCSRVLRTNNYLLGVFCCFLFSIHGVASNTSTDLAKKTAVIEKKSNTKKTGTSHHIVKKQVVRKKPASVKKYVAVKKYTPPKKVTTAQIKKKKVIARHHPSPVKKQVVLKKRAPNKKAIAAKSSKPLIIARSKPEVAQRIAAIEKASNTIMGVTAIHIEKNEVIEHNSDKRFFMASTIKLPIALAFLHRVDEKKDSLNRVIKLDSSNSVPGSGSLYHLFEKKRMSISLKQVLKYMLSNSDNSASDTILQEVNGPAYVTRRMSALGFKKILINRSILEMLLDTNHVDHSLLNKPRPVYSWQKAFNSIPLEQKTQAWQRFQNDIRDTTTPDEMAQLLVKVYKNQALSAASTQVLMNIMEGCRTGRSRIKGLLPSTVKVAHKTGTWAINEQDYLRYPGSKDLFRFASDVGIITLPNNKGHIAIAVYVKSKAVNDYQRSRAIALTSRAIYDYFMVQ